MQYGVVRCYKTDHEQIKRCGCGMRVCLACIYFLDFRFSTVFSLYYSVIPSMFAFDVNVGIGV